LISDLVDQIFNESFFRFSRGNLKISLAMALEGIFWDGRDRSKPPRSRRVNGSGQVPDEIVSSEVVRDGLRALLERDAAVERWLREEVVPGHQEYLRDPSKGVPADAILGRIKARRASRKKQ
jgi:hypothetical protein